LVDRDPFDAWFEALERRHLADLTFSEVRRSVQTLSSIYVERRDRLNAGVALRGAGKRAAFALFFAPLHFLLVREIVRALNAIRLRGTQILDLGCGTGPAGAAWALETRGSTTVLGVEVNSWALEECRWNYRQLGIRGATRQTDLKTFHVSSNTAVVAAFTINELEPADRTRFRDEFLHVHRSGFPVLIVEPIARKLTEWWSDWTNHISAAGGRADEWRFRIPLRERLALMDRAAGLDHRELTGRSLWLPGAR
jgi:methyltransferase family protein